MRKQQGVSKATTPTTWGADWDYFGTADRCRHTLDPSPCCIQEVSIVTVAPIRDLGNISSSTTSNTSSSSLLNLPTVSFRSNIEMDIFSGIAPDNYDEVRGRSLSTNINISRDSSMSSTRSSVAYHEKIEENNAMIIDNDSNDSSPALSYEDK